MQDVVVVSVTVHQWSITCWFNYKLASVAWTSILLLSGRRLAGFCWWQCHLSTVLRALWPSSGCGVGSNGIWTQVVSQWHMIDTSVTCSVSWLSTYGQVIKPHVKAKCVLWEIFFGENPLRIKKQNSWTSVGQQVRRRRLWADYSRTKNFCTLSSTFTVLRD